MLGPITGDVILFGSIDSTYLVVDAMNKHRVAGPFPLQEAIAVARKTGARNIFQQSVDERGRVLGDPVRLVTDRAPNGRIDV